MRLGDITATAHTDGNRIDLSWSFPDPAHPPGVRVVRAERTHPVTPNDGVTVADGTGFTTATDTNLLGEHVYYYALFPFTGNPPVYDPDPHNLAEAMATSSYDFAGQLYALLPAIYRRYDAEATPADRPGPALATDPGQLRGFLDLPGAELDRLYSLNRAALGLLNADRVDGSLLPLLAQWIGWHTDFTLPVGTQRNEIRYAPRLYQTTGGVPTVDATVARVTGWTNRTKEFVHNVARSNQPERLNLWSATRDTTGNWSASALASVNFAYDGRPVAVRDTDGSTLVFYQTHRQHGWDIWSKRFAGGAWQPSQPVTDQPGVDKTPTAALQGNLLWLFWQTYDPTQTGPHWQISFSQRSGTVWSPPAAFGDATTPRRLPAAVADNTGGVWLFWLERVAGGWQVRYNRHNGTAWQLTTPATLPLDSGADPRVEDDLFVLFHPTSTTQRLWLFWSRHDPGGPAGQTRSNIVYRVKQGLDPTVSSDWSQIRALPRTTTAYHDRQPAALLTPTGDIEVFFSSTQNGGWTIVRNTLAVASLTWGTNQQVVGGPYARRGPMAADLGNGTLLVYRSNASIPHASGEFGATNTLDNRYAGTTTVDTGGTQKLALRGKFEDFQTYTYDIGGSSRTNDDRISRDTVGLYLTPNVTDPAQIKATTDRLAGVLADFTPVTTRSVFITP